MQATSTADLARTRRAFETWRSSQLGRRRIPDHLCSSAVALLDHYSLTCVARELRLSPTRLKRWRGAITHSLPADQQMTPTFLTLGPTDLAPAKGAGDADAPPPACESVEAEGRLVFERADGSRLVLCVPTTEWASLNALCATFLRH